MTRWKAAGIHLSLSLLIGTIAFCLLYFVYYPQPFFVAAGADVLVLILLGVDVALGPLLTLVVFKSGKKSLKFDLTVVAALQVGALCYGLFIMWNARPIFIVAAVDRFEVVFAGEIRPEAYKNAEFPQFSSEPKFGPVFVALRRPKPGSEQTEIMDATFAGMDTRHFPRYFLPYTPENTKAFWATHRKINDLPLGTRIQAEQFIAKASAQRHFIAMPLMGSTLDETLLVDSDSKELVKAIPETAWQ